MRTVFHLARRLFQGAGSGVLVSVSTLICAILFGCFVAALGQGEGFSLISGSIFSQLRVSMCFVFHGQEQHWNQSENKIQKHNTYWIAAVLVLQYFAVMR